MFCRSKNELSQIIVQLFVEYIKLLQSVSFKFLFFFLFLFRLHALCANEELQRCLETPPRKKSKFPQQKKTYTNAVAFCAEKLGYTAIFDSIKTSATSTLPRVKTEILGKAARS